MSEYTSRYTDRLVSAPQYIAEIMCERIAKSKKMGDLPTKFWNLPDWKKLFKQQLLLAFSLLKIYSDGAIINGLANPKSFKAYSLGASHILDTIFQAEQKKIDSFEHQVLLHSEIAQSSETSNTSIKPKPQQPKKNIFRDLNE